MRTAVLAAAAATLVIFPLAPTLRAAGPPTASALSSEKCPVNFAASRTAGLQVRRASRDGDAATGQGLHLQFGRLLDSGADSARFDSAIRSVEVTVHSTEAQAGVLPVVPGASPTLDRSFRFNASDRRHGLTESELWVGNAGVLRSVDLESVVFADGTRWHAAHPGVCRAVPSPLLLVGLQ